MLASTLEYVGTAFTGLAAASAWVLAHLRSPIQFETNLETHNGVSVRNLRLAFIWKVGPERQRREWAAYFTIKGGATEERAEQRTQAP